MVVVPFPFADLSASKRRLALVVARAGGRDLLLSQVTSRATRDEHAVSLEESAFKEGGLRVAGLVRPNRLFTADESLVLYRAARVEDAVVGQVIARIKAMLDAP